MTDRPPKAEGMGWITPYLTVKNVKDAIDFYQKAFGLETKMTMPDKDGNIIHAEIGYNDCVIMIGAECPEEGSKSPATLSGSSVGLYIYVDDIDNFCAKARDTGAKMLTEPETMFWGDRMCSMECPEGHRWTFAQNVADFDPSKAPK